MCRIFYSRHWPWIAGGTVVLLFAVYLATVVTASECFGAGADPFVRYMLAFIAVQITLLTLLTLCLVFWKLRVARREREYEAQLQHSRALVTSYVMGDVHESIVLNLSEQFPLAFLDIMEESLRSLKGSPREQMEALFLKTEMFHSLFDPPSARNPRQILRVLSLLPFLSSPLPAFPFESSLAHPSPAIRIAALLTLLRCGKPEIQATVFQKMSGLPLFERILMYLNFPQDPTLISQFIQSALDSHEDEFILCALEFILHCEKLVSVPLPDALARSSNSEIRIKFFKAFHLLPARENAVELLRIGLDDNDWRVRAMSARACGLIRAVTLVPELLRMVSRGESSTEARRAAGALTLLGDSATTQLSRLRSGATDQVYRIIAEAEEKAILQGMEAVR
ncbi:MAG: HEAT repeat domain-containing protein [Terriglobia bacterium]